MILELSRLFLSQRVRWQLRHDFDRSADPDRDTLAEIDDLVGIQLARWTARPLDRAAAECEFLRLNATYPSTFLLRIGRGRVEIAAKPPSTLAADALSAYSPRMLLGFACRIEIYRVFIEETIRRFDLGVATTLALDVNDTGPESASAPLFRFQKPAGSADILLPDIDFINQNWYRGVRDPIAYDDKRLVASFVGSSTGARVSVEAIERSEVPRLRAAACFVGSDLVDFRIAAIVQTTSAEARALLRRQPYISRPVGWGEQFRNRFLISIDGNGAACSRLAIALKSRAAVIKDDSPHQLYYFPKLTPGRDFIPVSDDAAVAAVVARERADPGAYRPVAQAGRAFFARFLERRPVMAYMARLLVGYAAL